MIIRITIFKSVIPGIKDGKQWSIYKSGSCYFLNPLFMHSEPL